MKLKHLLTLLALLAGVPLTHAGIHHWNGGGGNELWSNPANWIEGAPTAGEAAPVQLIFPIAGVKTLTNDIPALTVDTLQMFGSGYVLRGIGGASLTLRGGQATTLYCRGVNTIAGSLPVTLQGTCVIDVEGGTNVLTLSSVVSGTGGLTKVGLGALVYASVNSNTYTGTTTVLRGPLRLGNASLVQNKIAIPGPLVIGDSNQTNSPNVRLLVSHQIANTSSVTINENGTLRLDGFDDAIGALTMTGGTIYTDDGADIGTLTLGGDVTYHHTPVIVGGIAGHLSLGNATRTFNIVSGVLNLDEIEGGPAAGIIKTGSGELGLNSASTYQGHTTVNGGYVQVRHSQALGLFGTDASGTTVNYPGALSLHNNAVVTGERLFLNNLGELVMAGNSVWSGEVTVTGAGEVNAFNGASCAIEGVIRGTGTLVKTGLGTLRLEGPTANLHTGGTLVRHGTLQLAKFSGVAAIPGSLTVGDGLGAPDADKVVLIAHNQIADEAEIRITDSGLLDVNGFVESLGPITFDGGHLDSGGLFLQLLGDITVEPRNDVIAVIDGQIRLSGAGMVFNVAGGNVSPDLKISGAVLGAADRPFIKTGAGQVYLYNSANTYDGQTRVQQGTLGLQVGAQPGSAVGNTVVSNGATLFIANNTHVSNETLALHGSGLGGTTPAIASYAGTNSWGGNIHFSAQSVIQVYPTNSLLTLSGKLDGPKAFTKIGSGTLRLGGDTTNNYIGTVLMKEGVLELNKLASSGAINSGGIIIGDTNGVANSVIVRALRDNQFAWHVPVVVQTSALLDLNFHPQSIGSLAGAGNVYLAFSKLMLWKDADTIFSGVIGGVSTNGSLQKIGGGRFILTGTNTYTGTTAVNDGNLFVNGQQPGSDVLITAGGALNGSGRVGDISGQGGVLSPGNDGVFGSGLARLSSGNVALSGNSGFWVDLAGTDAGANYCQLDVTGTVNLGNAGLSVKLAFASAVSNRFMIVRNDGIDLVVGTFKGLPEGATTTFNGVEFRISYTGGTGNDVVLTQLTATPPPQLVGVTRLDDGQIQLTGTGFPGLTYTIEGNFDLGSTNWVNLGEITAQPPTGALQFIDLNATNYPMRFYRFVLP